MLSKIKGWSYVLLVVGLAALTTMFYCDARDVRKSNRSLRTAALEDAANEVGAKVATTVGANTLKKAAKEAVGVDPVEGMADVATVESVATTTFGLATSAHADVNLDGQLLTIRGEHGRLTVTGEAKDKTRAKVELTQTFKYGLVRFHGAGEALILRVSELSPLDGSTLTSQSVPLDSFLIAKPRGRGWRERFGWQLGCGVGAVADMDNPVNVYCGLGWGLNF